MYIGAGTRAHFEQLRARQPDNPAVLRGLARCRWDLGQLDEARQLLDSLLAAHPREAEALYDRGRLAMQLDQPAEAEAWLRKAVVEAPHHYEASYSLYQCLQRRGNNEEAAKQLARLERLQAQLDCLTELTKKIGDSPRDAGLRYEVGLIFLDTGQDHEGLRWLASAVQEDPGHSPTHLALAGYYERTGNSSMAARHRRLARQGNASTESDRRR